VSFKEGALIYVLPHIHDNLPVHVKGEAYWVSYENHEKSAYHIEDNNRQERPIEFVNHGWYYLEWKDSLYWTSKNLLIKGEVEECLGWWNESDLDHPGYQKPILSPLEPRTPTTTKADTETDSRKEHRSGWDQEEQVLDPVKEEQRLEYLMKDPKPADLQDKILSAQVQQLVSVTSADFRKPLPPPGSFP
jgi:hypothetical protein